MSKPVNPSGLPLSTAFVDAVRKSIAKCTPLSSRPSTLRSRGTVAPALQGKEREAAKLRRVAAAGTELRANDTTERGARVFDVQDRLSRHRVEAECPAR